LRKDTSFRLFRDYLHEEPETIAMNMRAQLSMQDYIQDMLALLAERWTEVLRNKKERLEAFVTMAELEDEEEFGRCGLSCALSSLSGTRLQAFQQLCFYPLRS
jgi:hypothetical protein